MTDRITLKSVARIATAVALVVGVCVLATLAGQRFHATDSLLPEASQPGPYSSLASGGDLWHAFPGR